MTDWNSQIIDPEELEKAIYAVELTLNELGLEHEVEAQLVLNAVLSNCRQRNNENRILEGNYFTDQGDLNEG